MTIRWPSRIVAFMLWALAAMLATFWLLKVAGVSEAPVKAGAIGVETPAVDVQNLARALGPAPVTGTATADVPAQISDAGARMRLLGVVAGRKSGGIALIAIEGQPPRPYRVGSQVDANHTLIRVATRSATLSPTQPNSPPCTLEVPPTTTAPAPPLGPWSGAGANRIPGLTQTIPVPAMGANPGVAAIVAPAANDTTITPTPDAAEKTKY